MNILKIVAGAALAVSAAWQADAAILVDTTNQYGANSSYGTSTPSTTTSNFTSYLAAQSTGLTAGSLSDAAAVDSATAILLNMRQNSASSLTSTQITNLQNAIAAGLRVLIIGDNNGALGQWNQSFISAVGNGATYSTTNTNGAATVASASSLTSDVSSITIGAGSTVTGGNNLFSQNVAATFGPSNNVLLVMDSNLFNNSANAGNTQFQQNVANWLGASAVPEPSSWGMMILGFGVIGVMMRRQRKVSVRFG